MPRYHSGGFVDPQFYFNIGTEDARGRDGDTARTAAQKYNDHRHSAYVAVSSADLNNWKNEFQSESADPISNNPGGLLETVDEFIRLPGDLAELNAVLYATTSTSLKSISSGFGVHLDTTGVVPTLAEDFVSTNYTMLRRPTPLGGIDCLFAPDANNQLRQFSTTVADCVLYPSIQAGSGDLVTQAIITAGIRVSDDCKVLIEGVLRNIPEPLRVGIYVRPKYYPYDDGTQRIVSSNVIEGPQTLITSMTGHQLFADTVSNANDIGHTVVGVLSLSGNFAGRVELEMSFDLEGCYSADEYNNLATTLNRSVPALKDEIAQWAEQHVKLDLLDATARVLCTFKGE